MVYFQLFANCIPVRGAARSVVCDLEKGRLKYIPNLLFDVLEKGKSLPVELLKRHYQGQYDQGIDEYFTLLAKEGFGHFTDSPEHFPPLDLSVERPLGLLQNAMLELEWPLCYEVPAVLAKLQGLGCRAISLYMLGHFPKLEFSHILTLLQRGILRYIEVFVSFEMGFSDEEVWKLLRQHPRLQRFEIYDSSFDQTVHHDNIALRGRFKKIKESPLSRRVGFAPNLPAFVEAQRHNLALNGRACIDKEGFIKNDLAHGQRFGQASTDNLGQVLAGEAFQKMWHLGNDLIKKCRDCEHRYICADFSEVLEGQEGGGLVKANDCGYNPYLGVWNAANN